MTFETSRLRPGEIVAAVGAVLLFIFMFFFKWYGVGGAVGDLARSFGVDVSVNGWNGHTVLRWLMLLTILAALALAFLTATQRTVALPVTMAVVVTALSALLTLLLAYRVVINHPGPDSVVGTKPGAWLGLLSSAAIVYGGYLSMREEGTSFADAREQARDAGRQARAAFESAAPPRADEGSSAPPPPPPPAGATPPAPAAGDGSPSTGVAPAAPADVQPVGGEPPPTGVAPAAPAEAPPAGDESSPIA